MYEKLIEWLTKESENADVYQAGLGYLIIESDTSAAKMSAEIQKFFTSQDWESPQVIIINQWDILVNVREMYYSEVNPLSVEWKHVKHE